MKMLGRRRLLTLALGGALVLIGGRVTERAAVAQTEPTRLKAEDLPKFLTGLGFEPESTGNGVYRITVERGKFTFRVNTSVSGNLKKVWFSTYLLAIPEEKKTPDFLAKLLAANSDTGPAHF